MQILFKLINVLCVRLHSSNQASLTLHYEPRLSNFEESGRPTEYGVILMFKFGRLVESITV